MRVLYMKNKVIFPNIKVLDGREGGGGMGGGGWGKWGGVCGGGGGDKSESTSK